jgi:hypothetical protein
LKCLVNSSCKAPISRVGRVSRGSRIEQKQTQRASVFMGVGAPEPLLRMCLSFTSAPCIVGCCGSVTRALQMRYDGVCNRNFTSAPCSKFVEHCWCGGDIWAGHGVRDVASGGMCAHGRSDE